MLAIPKRPPCRSIFFGVALTCLLGTQGCGDDGLAEPHLVAVDAPKPSHPGATRPRLAPAGFTSLALGNNYTCGLAKKNGGHYCWGRNHRGQFGNGTQTGSVLPTQGLLIYHFTELTAGWSHTCGTSLLGNALCWGTNTSGQLGVGTTTDLSVPAFVLTGETYVQLTAGSSHTCGRRVSNNLVSCWGNNSSGQLGNGTWSQSSQPVPVQWSPSFTDISAGFAHTCAVQYGGSAFCWGAGADGQLGNLNTYSVNQPTAVYGSNAYIQITAGHDHTCALTTQYDAYCWGDDEAGELGDGPGGSGWAPLPQPVAGSHKFKSISAGHSFTCGVLWGGQGMCWGFNGGRLGNGSLMNSDVPVFVSGGHQFSEIEVGLAHACGITTVGITVCWGSGAHGQLGNGKALSSTVPVVVVWYP